MPRRTPLRKRVSTVAGRGRDDPPWTNPCMAVLHVYAFHSTAERARIKSLLSKRGMMAACMILIELHDHLSAEFDSFAKIILEHVEGQFIVSVCTSQLVDVAVHRVDEVARLYLDDCVEKFLSDLRVDFQHPRRRG